MNGQQTNQNDTSQPATNRQAAAESGPAGGQEADAHAATQAARAVMHPDHHDLEWRFYHGAVHG